MGRKFAYENLDRSLYDEFKKEHEDRIVEIQDKLAEGEIKISNIENYLDASTDILSNLNKYWAYDDLKIKHKIKTSFFRMD